MKKSHLVFITFMMFAALSNSVIAQTLPQTKGFVLGAAINGSSIEIDDDELGDAVGNERQSGGGLTLHLGYNFTKSLGIFLSGTAAKIDNDADEDFTLGQGDLGFRYTFAGSSAFVPYLELAVTALNAEPDTDEVDIELRGQGLTGGLGFNYFFSRKVAFDMNLMFTGGEFDTVKFDGGSISTDDGANVTTGRINIGIAFYPSAGRGRR